jgi:ATP-binding cassette subfamily C protein CydC
VSGPTGIGQWLGDETAGGRRLVKPATMVVLSILLGAGLLGLAGWFIAASAVAGLAAASTFSFLFPSAGVQALAWARTLGRYGERITTHEATLDLAGSLRTRLFARALGLSRDSVAELRSGELLGRITVDSDAVENLLLRSIFPVLSSVAALIGTAGLFVLLSPALAVLLVVGALITGGVLVGLARHQAGPPASRWVAARARARHTLIETLDGLPELRSFGAEQRAADSVSGALTRFTESRQHLTRLEAAGRSVGTLLTDLTLLAVVATAAGLIGTGALPAPAFVAVSLLAIAALETVVGVHGARAARARACAAFARLGELFPDRSTRASPALHVVEGVLWQVDVAPVDPQGPFGLRPGETILLTGASGSGKSTILRAITGQSTAVVHVDFAGVDAASIDPEALAAHVTLVAQDAHIFDGTVRDNLVLAAPGATEPELWKALAAAALDDTVAGFPGGLDTPVGPGGTALSGGQRRRLSVAQGLLRRADVLLLDEPTESLDAQTAARLLAGVRAFDPNSGLVIALHDRQSPQLPWTPDTTVELRRRGLETKRSG